MRAKNTIPDCAFEHDQSHPDAGATSRGKSNDVNDALGKPRSGSAVTEAHCDDGTVARKAIAQQIGMHDIGSDGAPGISGNGHRGN